MVLSRSEGGRSKLISLAENKIVPAQVLTERYQRFRRARAQLGLIHRQMLLSIDKLEAARRREP